MLGVECSIDIQAAVAGEARVACTTCFSPLLVASPPPFHRLSSSLSLALNNPSTHWSADRIHPCHPPRVGNAASRAKHHVLLHDTPLPNLFHPSPPRLITWKQSNFLPLRIPTIFPLVPFIHKNDNLITITKLMLRIELLVRYNVFTTKFTEQYLFPNFVQFIYIYVFKKHRIYLQSFSLNIQGIYRE